MTGLTEDELVKALKRAHETVNVAYRPLPALREQPRSIQMLDIIDSVIDATALLEAARLIRVLEWPGSGQCPVCWHWESIPIDPSMEGHTPECEVGRWVRAAARAGL